MKKFEKVIRTLRNFIYPVAMVLSFAWFITSKDPIYIVLAWVQLIGMEIVGKDDKNER